LERRRQKEGGTPGFVGVGVLIHGSSTVGTTADGAVRVPVADEGSA